MRIPLLLTLAAVALPLAVAGADAQDAVPPQGQPPAAGDGTAAGTPIPPALLLKKSPAAMPGQGTPMPSASPAGRRCSQQATS